jgi:hypothetical protein
MPDDPFSPFEEGAEAFREGDDLPDGLVLTAVAEAEDGEDKGALFIRESKWFPV